MNRSSHRVGASCEPLETRRLLSAAALSHSGVLRVAGDKKVANTIDVELSPDAQSIVVNVQSPGARKATSLTKTFPAANVKRIDVTGGKQADVITIGTTSALAVRTRVFGLAGDDHITTGAGNDRVNGGLGNDTISTGEGDDLIRGEKGDDTIDAGGGNDVVHAGRGSDTVTGGPGDDTLWGGLDDDSLDGGDGNDKLGGVLGANHLTGGPGQDTFVVTSLAQNPSNDYDPATDVLQIVVPKKVKSDEGDGPKV